MTDLEITFTTYGFWAVTSERYGVVRFQTLKAASDFRREILRCDDLRCSLCGEPDAKPDGDLGLVCDDCLLVAVGVAYG